MRSYLTFAAASLSLFMISMDGTAVAVALPDFIRDFDTTVVWAGWTLSVYMIAATSAMPLMGRLSDTFGRRPLYLASLLLFTLSSLACGLAPNIATLVGCRFLQGLGAAGFLPTASGIVSDQFPKSRERAIGLFSSIFSIGGIVGPILGGWIVSHYSWRYIFYINLPIGLGLLLLLLLLLEAPPPTTTPVRVDVTGAALFCGAILFLMVSLSRLAESLAPATWPLTGLSLALSLGGLALFFRHERAAPDPLLNLTLLQSRPFLAANLYNLLLGAGIFGTVSLIPLYATTVHSLSALLSGVILTPRSVGVICASTVTSFCLARWGYRAPMLWGVGALAAGTLLLGDVQFLVARALGIQVGAAALLAAEALLLGLGMGIASPASNNACIELMPSHVATITGLRGMFRFVGGALGISLATIILRASATLADGFRNAFVAAGLLQLLAVPLVFFLPRGSRESGKCGRAQLEPESLARQRVSASGQAGREPGAGDIELCGQGRRSAPRPAR
jgi:EmrB/QacA subfamily drug resistance transporter